MNTTFSYLIALSVMLTCSFHAWAADAKANKSKPYPNFQIGVTGVEAKIEEGKMKVTKVVDGSPAMGKLKSGDIIVSVAGKPFVELEIKKGGGPHDP